MRNLSVTTLGILCAAGAAMADPESVTSPDSAGCWVELHSEPGLAGDKVRLQGPVSQATAALADSDGENFDDIAAVKTGPTARVEFFEQADFSGRIYRVYEDSHEKVDDDASSLKVACIDPTPDVSAAPADCWVEFYDANTLDGNLVRITGPEEGSLARFEYNDGEDLDDDVRGVRTGPTARVELFERDDFTGKSHRVFPSQTDALASSGFGEDASSIKVTCQQ